MQPRDKKPSERTVTLTSKTVSSQRVRPEAAYVSLPVFAVWDRKGGQTRRKPEGSYLSAFYNPDPFTSQPKESKTLFILCLLILIFRQVSWGKKDALPPGY